MYLAETTSIQWRPNMKNPGHDVFINEAIKLEQFMDDLLSKTLISFVEAKVVKARFSKVFRTPGLSTNRSRTVYSRSMENER